ncbi:MAG: flagellar hook-length control protein FliK [Treponema sp.]|nr:flagellar hook-length control protein FliK [Treponema sp.]
MLAVPNASTISQTQKSKQGQRNPSLFKSNPLSGSFEGILKKLQSFGNSNTDSGAIIGSKEQSVSKTGTVDLQRSLQSVKAKAEGTNNKTVPQQQTEKRSPFDPLHNGVQKSIYEGNSSSNLPLKEAEGILQKKKNFYGETSDPDTVLSRQGITKQNELSKQGRNGRAVQDSGSEQNLAILASQNGSLVQSRQSTIKAEKQDEAASTPEKRTEKTRDRRKERIDIEVYDLRTQSAEQKAKPNEISSSAEGNTKTAELTVHLKEEGIKKDKGESWTAPLSPSRSFQDMLAQELRTSLNGDIVKHASMVLKDGGEGLIRLNLKPESLGNIRIKLEMADNKVSGHIVVESEEALRAFEKELHSLEQAFKDWGFQGASLEISVSADGRGSSNRRQDNLQQPFYSERLVAGTYSETVSDVPLSQNSQLSSGTNVSINMLA